MKKNTFLSYCDHATMINKLTDKQAGLLLKALHAYVANEIEPDFNNDTALDMVFTAHKTIIDKDSAAYAEKCRKNKKIAQKRWEKYNENK